jgi:hypothetical protein
MAWASDDTLRTALREAEDSLAQARGDAWGAFDQVADSDPQRAVDTLLADLERRIGPLVDTVMRLGGDPRKCWPGRHPPPQESAVSTVDRLRAPDGLERPPPRTEELPMKPASMAPDDIAPSEPVPDGLSFLWLEITGACQLRCRHCYSDSGPRGTHGSMTIAGWMRVIDQAAALGVSLVQFIGGEPTLHPGLPALIEHTLSGGMEVEVYTNLSHISEGLWRVFAQPGVRLAASYYSADAQQHDVITGRSGSHARTRTNIVRALDRGIPIRIGTVEVDNNQVIEAAVDELKGLGVPNVRRDRVREVGRGAGAAGPGIDQLCGHCMVGRLAISPAGDVWPCPFARWMWLGSVHHSSLTTIYVGTEARKARRVLRDVYGAGSPGMEQCPPDGDGSLPQPCDPHYQCDPFSRK